MKIQHQGPFLFLTGISWLLRKGYILSLSFSLSSQLECYVWRRTNKTNNIFTPWPSVQDSFPPLPPSGPGFHTSDFWRRDQVTNSSDGTVIRELWQVRLSLPLGPNVDFNFAKEWFQQVAEEVSPAPYFLHLCNYWGKFMFFLKHTSEESEKFCCAPNVHEKIRLKDVSFLFLHSEKKHSVFISLIILN